MQFRFDLSRDEWFSMLCAEDEVNEDRRQGLRHVFSLVSLNFALSALLLLVRILVPGPLAQAITFRALGAYECFNEIKVTLLYRRNSRSLCA